MRTIHPFRGLSRPTPVSLTTSWLSPGTRRGRGGGGTRTCCRAKDNAERDPFEVLKVSPSSTLEEVKVAFREQIKAKHPDVNYGDGAIDTSKDAEALIRAYQDILENFGKDDTGRKKRSDEPMRDPLDVFSSPDGPPNYVFVNQMYCRGANCPEWCQCVETCPSAFQFDEENGLARLKENAPESRLGCSEDDDYQLYLAVSQCPQDCLYFVTRGQQAYLKTLQQEMASMLSDQVVVQNDIDLLISQSQYENNRVP